MILCSECSRGYHWWCVDLASMPSAADWFCGPCRSTMQTRGFQSSDYLPLSQNPTLVGYTAPSSSTTKGKRPRGERGGVRRTVPKHKRNGTKRTK